MYLITPLRLDNVEFVKYFTLPIAFPDPDGIL